MKSIGTNPRNDGARGDERIRTAVCVAATDPAYEQLSIDGAGVRRSDPVPHDGNVVVSAYVGRNDTLVAEASRLFIADGDRVADVTYGNGGFWKCVETGRFELVASDLATGVDFRSLPYESASFDVVVLDPPYIYNPKGTVKRSISGVYRVNESQSDIATTEAVIDLYLAGMGEAFRVLKPGGLLWVKCQDGIESGKPRWNHITLALHGTQMGFGIRDLFVLVQETRPTIRWPHQLHARKNHSYLWIMEKPLALAAVARREGTQ